jgi:hypothetical protein
MSPLWFAVPGQNGALSVSLDALEQIAEIIADDARHA